MERSMERYIFSGQINCWKMEKTRKAKPERVSAALSPFQWCVFFLVSLLWKTMFIRGGNNGKGLRVVTVSFLPYIDSIHCVSSSFVLACRYTYTPQIPINIWHSPDATISTFSFLLFSFYLYFFEKWQNNILNVIDRIDYDPQSSKIKKNKVTVLLWVSAFFFVVEWAKAVL